MKNYSLQTKLLFFTFNCKEVKQKCHWSVTILCLLQNSPFHEQYITENR